MYQFSRECSSIILGLEITRLDGIDIDREFVQDQRFMRMDQSVESSGEIFTVDTYRVIMKTK